MADQQFWIVVYDHRYGTDAWPVFGAEVPDLKQIANDLDDFEPDDEHLDLSGPFDIPHA